MTPVRRLVLPPLVEPEAGGRGLVIDVGLSALLLAGVAAVSRHPAVRALLFGPVGPSRGASQAGAGQG